MLACHSRQYAGDRGSIPRSRVSSFLFAGGGWGPSGRGCGEAWHPPVLLCKDGDMGDENIKGERHKLMSKTRSTPALREQIRYA
jgi:hypothetical protein